MTAASPGLPSSDHGPTFVESLDFTGQTVLLDCRWLGFGGAGRVTELLLEEMHDAPPSSGRWVLWGDPAILAQFVFGGASVAPWTGHPARLYGQADWLRVPQADVRLYLHQVRPLRRGRSVTFVYDTIPLHFEPRRLVRLAKWAFLRSVCRMSDVIITVSKLSKDSLVRELAVDAARIEIVGLTVDEARIARIRAMRQSSLRSERLIFVGRFLAHKNLQRLCRAFDSTRFHHQGGRLLLAGGSPDEVARLTAWIREQGLAGIDVMGHCPEPELDGLLAGSRALVQPSIEEGYGLPAIEAAAIGLPVAATRTGYAPEIPDELVAFMDAADEHSIAVAIDDVTTRPDPELNFRPRSTLRGGVLAAIARAM